MVRVMGIWNRMNWCGSILATLLLLNPAAQCAGDEPAPDSELAQYYGFTGVEITKLHERAEHLKSGDFNGDGLTDEIGRAHV